MSGQGGRRPLAHDLFYRLGVSVRPLRYLRSFRYLPRCCFVLRFLICSLPACEFVFCVVIAWIGQGSSRRFPSACPPQQVLLGSPRRALVLRGPSCHFFSSSSSRRLVSCGSRLALPRDQVLVVLLRVFPALRFVLITCSAYRFFLTKFSSSCFGSFGAARFFFHKYSSFQQVLVV